MPDIVTNVLYQEIDRLQEKVKELEEENDADRRRCCRYETTLEAADAGSAAYQVNQAATE